MNNLEIIDINEVSYKDLCEEMRSVLQLEKEVAAKKAELREKIIDRAGGDRLEYGIKVTFVKGTDRVDYKGIALSAYSTDQIEQLKEKYKTKVADSWKITSY